jgi:predicted dehydrogenase
MVGVGVVGCGYWGPNLVRNFFETRKCELIAVCDNNPENLKKISEKFPSLPLVDSYDLFLKNNKLDAVCIATPVSAHFEMTKKALEAGKHVFVEKPLTGDSESSRELVELAKKKSLILMVGHVFVYNPAVRKIREMMANGEIGVPRVISCVRTSLGPRVRTDVNILWDYAIHEAYIFPYILSRKPVAVSATASSFLQEGIEDWVQFSIRFEGDVYANGYVSWCDPQKRRNMTIVGSEKMLYYDDLAEKKLVLFNRGYKQIKGTDKFGNVNLELFDMGESYPTVGSEETLRLEVEHFIDCIKAGKVSQSSGEEGVQTIMLLEKMQESIDNNGVFIPMKE